MEASFKGEGSVAIGDDRSLIQVSSFNQLFAALGRSRSTLCITLNVHGEGVAQRATGRAGATCARMRARSVT
jgi:hypothetical protein